MSSLFESHSGVVTLTKLRRIVSDDNSGIVSVPLKSLTHSALKDFFFSCNLHTTSNVIRCVNLGTKTQELQEEKIRLEQELKEEKEKRSKLDLELKAKQNEYNIMFKQGTEIYQQFNFLHQQNQQNVKKIEALEQALNDKRLRNE